MPFKWNLKELLCRDGLDGRIFWPPDTQDWEIGLQEMTARRNEYIHHGRIEDYDLNIRDARRLTSLISIWLLKRLGYPFEKLNEIDEDWSLARRAEFDNPCY